jgi:NADPH:quinone reductase-like Zn-dependent oxidoreductase
VKAVDHTFAEVELPKPTAAGHDLLVKVEAISVNPVDYKQRKQATSSKILGWDAAGTVAAVGSETKLFRPGDEVYYAGDVTRRAATASTTWSTSASSGASRRSSTSRRPRRCPSPRSRPGRRSTTV